MMRKIISFSVLSALLAGLILAPASGAFFQPVNDGIIGTGLAQSAEPAPDMPGFSQFSSPSQVREFLTRHTEGGNGATVPGSSAPAAGTVNSTRTWEFVIDTSAFRPDEYIVTANAVQQSVTGTALFNLLDPSQRRTPQPSPASGEDRGSGSSFISVDQIGEYYVGDIITVTGQTNLAAEDEILVQVYSSSFRPTQKSQSGEFSGATGTVRVSSAVSAPAAVTTSAPPAEAGRKYSTTNVQVRNVDEGDIVKTDGTYIYVVTGNTLHILNGYPADSAAVIATLRFTGTPQALYLSGDQLVLISSVLKKGDYLQCPTGACRTEVPSSEMTQVFVYSVKDPAHPSLVRKLESDGMHRDSRMVGPVLYLITDTPSDLVTHGEMFPAVYDSSRGTSVPPVYYTDRSDSRFMFTTITAVDTRGTLPAKARTFLIGSAGTVYASPDMLYLAIPGAGSPGISASTDLYAFTLTGNDLACSAHGSIEGTLLSRYSLDEYDGNLRAATTVMTGSWQNTGGSHSKVTVLDRNLDTIGTLSGLAPGEKIYAARFMGDRLYLVTYRETDPLFVIGLADPHNPKVLGELHIPGFSSYLHPYNETCLIGVGKESTRGGLKIALFDVSDVGSPRLVDEMKIGGYGSDSEVFYDPKAFLFDREKDLVVLPVRAAGNGKGSTETWGGACVFGVSPVTGFTQKGTVVHYTGSGNGRDVKRSFFIEETLYTMATDKIVMSDLQRNVTPVGVVGLP